MQCRSPEVNRRLPRRFLLHADSVELLREVRRAQVTKIDDAGSEEIGLDTSDVSSQCRQVLDCACLLALSKAPPRPKAPEDRRSPRRWRAHYSRLRYQLDSLTAFSASPQAGRASARAQKTNRSAPQPARRHGACKKTKTVSPAPSCALLLALRSWSPRRAGKRASVSQRWHTCCCLLDLPPGYRSKR